MKVVVNASNALKHGLIIEEVMDVSFLAYDLQLQQWCRAQFIFKHDRNNYQEIKVNGVLFAYLEIMIGCHFNTCSTLSTLRCS